MEAKTTNTIKRIVSATVKENQLQKLSHEKRMRSRKWISWAVWLIITAVSLYLIKTGTTNLDINLVIKMFGIVTVIYILGNVVEKFIMLFASKLADIVANKIDSFIDS